MNEFLVNLKNQFAAASAGAKLTLALGVAALIAVVVIANNWATAPTFKLLYSELDSRSAAAVESALAGANVRYQKSQPPGPYVISVDETQFYAAQNAVAIAGALSSAPEGIQTNGSGASQVFLSASERAQNALKREWQELEKQLEELDFVQRAHVSTSTPEGSSMRKTAPMTVAVTLTLRGRGDLTSSQANTVAKLAKFRFNVPLENVLIADQSGRSLYDGSMQGDRAGATTLALEHGSRYDEELARKTNDVLDRVFGPGMAYVVVNSKWQFGEVESVKESLSKPVVVEEKTNKTSTPQPQTPTIQAAGASPSTDPNAANATTATPPPAPAETPVATTNETQKTSVVGNRETKLERNNAPTLTRLGVSLYLDESQKDRLGDLEKTVKAAVGFDETRQDTFSSLVTPFASVKRDDKGQIVPPPAPAEVSAPSRMTEMLIQRGIEIGAAIAFLFLLFRTLKSSSKAAAAGAGAAGSGETMDEKTLELLAKTEIEELVKTDPQKVSSILSRWAAEEETVGAGR